MTPRQPTILIVDPDPVRAAPLTDELSREGFRVMPVASAEDALTLCRSAHFPVDLVVGRILATPVCGLQLAEIIEEEELPVRVLLTSRFKEDLLFKLPLFERFSDCLVDELHPNPNERLAARVYRALNLTRLEAKR